MKSLTQITSTSTTDKRGIDEKVKLVIDNCLKRSVRTARPVDIFTFLNLQKTREDEMKGLTQPTLTQIQTYVKNYRTQILGSSTAVTTTELKAKIKANIKQRL
jgi:hypothetical protein